MWLRHPLRWSRPRPADGRFQQCLLIDGAGWDRFFVEGSKGRERIRDQEPDLQVRHESGTIKLLQSASLNLTVSDFDFV